MSRSFQHDETGSSIHYNSDMSGMARVVLPFHPTFSQDYIVTDPNGEFHGGKHYPFATRFVSVDIPARLLADFSRMATIHEIICKIEDMM
jgi:hypothetical protein